MFSWTPKQSRPLSLCASNYFYFVVSWEITDGNDLNGEHDQWKFSGLNIVFIVCWNYIRLNFLDWSYSGGNFLGSNYPR